MRDESFSRLAVGSLVIAAVCSALAPRRASAWETVVDVRGFARAGLGVAATTDANVVVVGSADFVVVKLSTTTGQELWRYTAGPAGYTAAVAVDTHGDVITAGTIGDPVFAPHSSTLANPRFTVAKVSGATGTELWRQTVTGIGLDATGTGIDLALDAAGDVLASGSVSDGAIVVKLAGDTGAELWRFTADGGGGMFGDVMLAVKADPHGDVIAAGTFAPAQPTSTVVKLAGASGAQLWRSDLIGIRGAPGLAIAVGVSGDVAVEGWAGDLPVDGPSSVHDSVLMLSGATGSEIWRHDGNDLQVTSPPVPHLALRPSGDVVASDVQFGLAVFAASDGHGLWRNTLGCAVCTDTLPCRSSDAVQALAIDAEGDVVVAGSAVGCVPNPSTSDYLQRDFTIAKFSGANGTELWLRRYDAQPAVSFVAKALTVIPTGDVVAAGATSSAEAYASTFTVRDFSGTRGALMVCGDGYVDVGEQCDDGNPLNGGCCTSCRSARDGTSCSDGNRCTMNDTCTQGTCAASQPVPCEPCGTCAPETGCRTDLPFSCRTPTETGKAMLRLDTGRAGRRDALLWEWRSGAATTKAEFGDPRTTTGYALCVYGDQSTDAPVMLRATAPPGRTCSRRHGCWRAAAKGFHYRSSTGSPDGVHAVTLREGAPGRARITVAGDGHHLVLPALPLPLDPPLTVQLRKLDGSGPCWSASLDHVVRNRAHDFEARGN